MVISNLIRIFNFVIKHRIQGAINNLNYLDKKIYMEKEWISVPLCSFCSIPSNIQTTQIHQEVLIEDQLIKTLIGESKSPDSNIPLEFYKLVRSVLEPIDESTNNMEETWIEFGQWLEFKEPIKSRDVRKHLKNILKKIKNSAETRRKRNLEIPEEIIEIKSQNEKKQLTVLAQKNNVEHFHYIVNPECIVDKYNKTLVHLGLLDDYNGVIEATNAVSFYYSHLVDETWASHRSSSFWNNLTERFGAFRRYSSLPYTSSNTASLHNIAHQECVNKLLYAFQPLSNSVNRFVKQYYNHYFMKLSKLL